MKRICMLLILCILLALPVSAADFTAPEAPESAQPLMPAETESFSEGLWQIVTGALSSLRPELAEAASVCLGLVAVAMLASLLSRLPGKSETVVEFAACLGTGLLLLTRSNAMIRLASETVTEISEYGKLLMPVLTGALASQGGVTAAGALYAGTAAFDAILCSLIGKLLIPMVYMFLALSAAAAATAQESLGKMKDLLKWLATWSLKLVLYAFTGYIGLTGAISGTADAAAVKATKLTISSVVPVVGGILSDASETVLVSASVMKNAVGVYGVLAILSIWIAPFLKIGVQYLFLKATGAVCSAFQLKRVSALLADFTSALGLMLGMTGTVSVLLLVSIVCFMRVMA